MHSITAAQLGTVLRWVAAWLVLTLFAVLCTERMPGAQNAPGTQPARTDSRLCFDEARPR